MRSSILWEYYDREEKAEKAKCKTCNKEVSTSGGSTSGLKKHLRVHPKVLEDYLKKQEELEKHRPSVKRPAEDEAEARPLKQTKLDFAGKEAARAKQVDFDDALVNFVAETGVSFNVIGHPSFKELMGVANRNIDVKSPRTLSRKVDASSSNVLLGVHDVLAAVKSTIPSIGFTTDMWTSRAQVIPIHQVMDSGQFFGKKVSFLNCLLLRIAT